MVKWMFVLRRCRPNYSVISSSDSVYETVFNCMKGHRWLSQWWLNLYPHWMFPATALAVIILLFQFPSQWRFHNLTHDSTPCSFRWQHCALCRALPSQQLLAHRSAAEGRLPHNSDRWHTSWRKFVQNLSTRGRRQISAGADSLSTECLTYLRKQRWMPTPRPPDHLLAIREFWVWVYFVCMRDKKALRSTASHAWSSALPM